MTGSTRTPITNRDEWGQAADKVKEAVSSLGAMTGHASSAVGDMASRAACDVSQAADELTASAGSGIRQLSDRIERDGPQDGILGSASQAVARTVRQGGEYLEGAGMSGVKRDVTLLIQRNPVPSVCIAIGLGWLMARKLRN